MLRAILPHDYDIVQTVFKALARADWFDRNFANEKACAMLALSKYGDGGLDPIELMALCEQEARERFSRLP